MKKMTAKTGIIAGFIAFAGLSFTAIAWQDSTLLKGNQKTPLVDTVPDKHFDVDMNLKELDKGMKELDVQMDKLGVELKNMDFSKINAEIEAGLKNIDFNKIKLQIEQSLKEVDLEKIEKQVKESLSKVDWDKIKLEVDEAMKHAKNSINMEEIKKSLEQVKAVDMEKLKKEMEKVKEELEKNKDKMKIDIEKEMQKAKEELKKAKVELEDTRALLDVLEKDGLINTNEDFSVELKDKVLYLNGKKQSEEVTAKYRKYFKSDSFSISSKK